MDFYDKAIKCLYVDGEKVILQGNEKPTLVRIVTTMQEKRSYSKVCVFFTMYISSDKGKDVKDA